MRLFYDDIFRKTLNTVLKKKTQDQDLIRHKSSTIISPLSYNLSLTTTITIRIAELKHNHDFLDGKTCQYL